MKKIFFLILIACMICATLVFAFDWPKKNITFENFKISFGALRGKSFNNSVVLTGFSEGEKVFCTDNGRVTAIITEHENDGNWFESTLGNAAIICHKDNLLTVYGNLEKNSLLENTNNVTNINFESPLGDSGSSSWNDFQTQNENNQYIEFQISDSKYHTYINPLILMPRFSETGQPLTLNDIILESKDGRLYELQSTKNIPAGLYNLYKRRQETITPYTTSVYVNGTKLETISYDTILQNDDRLVVNGNSSYNVNEIYPDNLKQLVGQVLLPHGSATLTIIVSDILGNEKTLNYNLTIR